jgi:hypothetical protein
LGLFKIANEDSMPQDVLKMVEPYLSEDPTRWVKLASNIQWRRLQLLLLREILLELRRANRNYAPQKPAET